MQKGTKTDATEIITQLKRKVCNLWKEISKSTDFNNTSQKLEFSKNLNRIWYHSIEGNTSQNIVNEQGILALPNTWKSRFPQKTIDKVVRFYKNEEVGRVITGKNDYKTVIKNG